MSNLIEDALEAGIKLIKEGRQPEAEVIFKQILKVDPENLKINNLLAVMAFQMKQFGKASEYFKKCTELDPDNSDNYNDLSLTYAELGKLDMAVAIVKHAIVLSPKPLYYNNLAMHYRNQGRFDEAMKFVDLALESEPNNAQFWYNKAGVYSGLKDLNMAESCVQKTIEILPQPMFYGSLALGYLLRGNWNAGWELYENRLEYLPAATYYKQMYGDNRWKGQPLENKRIVVYCEQGLGDYILALRYIPELIKRGAIVLLHVSEDLRPLITQNFDVSVQTKKFEEYDYHVSIMSLPHYLKIEIPTEPYLKCNYSGDFSNYDCFKIGIVWGGNPQHAADRLRCCHLSYFKKIHDIPGVKLFSLQKDARPRAYIRQPDNDQVIDLTTGCEDMRIVDLSEFLNNWSNTAAFINNLDLLISIDTAVLNLAGAMGKPAWGLIPYSPDWRWGTSGEATIWYPSLRLFRQEQFNNWEPVFDKVYQEVNKLVSACRS